MSWFRKSPAKHSDDESDKKRTSKPTRTSSEPVLIKPDFNDDMSAARNKTRNGFRNKEELDMMSQQELEGYAVDRAEDTTKSVNNCLKIAENIREDATRTLDTLHEQGDQIHRTHQKAVDIDQDLSKGEKLLGNLGGMFSKPWKAKKTREIKGPAATTDNHTRRHNYEDREKLGLAPVPKGKSRTPPPEPTNALQKVEMEKSKQDDSLSDLSNILGDLKGMAVDMGSELDRQNKSLDHLHDDVEELNERVKGADRRARKLVAK